MFRMAGHVNDIIISVIPEVVECLGRTVNSRYAVLQTSTLSSISTCKNQELSDKVISEMSYSDLVVFFYLVWTIDTNIVNCMFLACRVCCIISLVKLYAYWFTECVVYNLCFTIYDVCVSSLTQDMHYGTF